MASLPERLKRESKSAYLAFLCYLDLGRARTFEGAWRAYADRRALTSLRASGSFIGWYGQHRWAERAESYDCARGAAGDAPETDDQVAVLERVADGLSPERAAQFWALVREAREAPGGR